MLLCSQKGQTFPVNVARYCCDTFPLPSVKFYTQSPQILLAISGWVGVELNLSLGFQTHLHVKQPPQPTLFYNSCGEASQTQPWETSLQDCEDIPALSNGGALSAKTLIKSQQWSNERSAVQWDSETRLTHTRAYVRLRHAKICAEPRSQ